jgi:ribose 5-phosphate isomerase B
MKEELKALLTELGHRVHDFGTDSKDAVDYPDFAHAVARAVADGSADLGIMIDGAGVGSAMTANKVPGVRAAVAWNEETARLAREHNDANVLSLGARVTPAEELPKIVRAWFAAKFAGGRHERRVEKIAEIEKEELGCGAPR